MMMMMMMNSSEPGVHLQRLCYDESTINIVFRPITIFSPSGGVPEGRKNDD